jgi:hypothetical protein|tara:strand:+ start:962 stop:1084 length:123 start_codon:yes stop_codon:yes gene_type:complete
LFQDLTLATWQNLFNIITCGGDFAAAITEEKVRDLATAVI